MRSLDICNKELPRDRVGIDTKHVRVEGSNELRAGAEENCEEEGGLPPKPVSHLTEEETANKQASNVDQLDRPYERTLNIG